LRIIKGAKWILIALYATILTTIRIRFLEFCIVVTLFAKFA